MEFHDNSIITSLSPNTIFVFGSNAMGAHAAGAAATAMDYFGAQCGIGHGLQGQSYAIDSMTNKEVFQQEILDFVHYAVKHSELKFYITAIGTGIAGYSHNEVADMFNKALPLPQNLIFPEVWRGALK